MRATTITIAAAALLAMTGLAAADGRMPAAAASPSDAAFAEMKQLFGVVPGFFKVLPPDAVPAAWEEFKGWDLNEHGALPGKTKTLISLAVASQIPCQYCSYADTEFAKLQGASTAEIREAVTMAAMTRRFSTILNGSLQDEMGFRKEIDAVVAHCKQTHGKPSMQVTVVDGASALKDVEAYFGSVPSFFKRIPAAALPGVWGEMKAVELSPTTALSGKDKELIGLAVAAQIPCRYCIYVHTQIALLNGATQPEIDEAIAQAGATRHWSAIMYGNQLDMPTFRKEVDGFVRRMKAMGPAK